jgi:hypothetical protein
MCMCSEGKIHRIEKDIICYKVVRLAERYRRPPHSGKFYIIERLCQGHAPVKGGLQRAVNFPMNANQQYGRFGAEGKEGGFYAYLFKKDAMSKKRSSWGKCVLLKCLIPKGVRVIRGTQGWNEAKAIRAEYMVHGIL